MFSRGCIVAIIVAVTSLQLRHSDYTRLNGQIEDPPAGHSGSPADAEIKGLHYFIGRTSELQAFAEAVQGLEQTKGHSWQSLMYTSPWVAN